MKKCFNGLFFVKEYLDRERDDYDSYNIGVQVFADDKESAFKEMQKTLNESIGKAFGFKAYFEYFCTETDFDIVGCDVL